MLADSVWIITRAFSSNNDLCCFRTEQLLCPSLKGTPRRFPQNKTKKVFSSKQTVRVLHSQQTRWMLFIPSKKKKKRKRRHWKQQNTTSWTKMRVVGEFHPQVGKYWRFWLVLELRRQPMHQYLTFALVVTEFVHLCLLTSCLPPPCFLLEHLFFTCYLSISGIMHFCSS